MLLYTWDLPNLRQQFQAEIDHSPDLQGLFAVILVKLVRQRLKIGLAHGYDNRKAVISGVKGRIDFNQTTKRMLLEKGKTFCSFQSYQKNIEANQIVKSTIAKLIQTENERFSGRIYEIRSLKSELRMIFRELEGIDTIPLRPGLIQRALATRHDQDYRLMLLICEMMNKRWMPTEDSGIEKFSQLDRSQFVLHDIFERFTAKFYQMHLKNWKVSAQELMKWPAEVEHPFLPRLVPDLILRSKTTEKLIILDTKFTAHSIVTGRWGNSTFNRDHLFQIYSYLKSQETRSNQFQNATGILLYPAVNQQLSESVIIQNHRIRWETINLTDEWSLIETRMIEMIEQENANSFY